jgi:hypothetical protein
MVATVPYLAQRAVVMQPATCQEEAGQPEDGLAEEAAPIAALSPHLPHSIVEDSLFH